MRRAREVPDEHQRDRHGAKPVQRRNTASGGHGSVKRSHPESFGGRAWVRRSLSRQDQWTEGFHGRQTAHLRENVTINALPSWSVSAVLWRRTGTRALRPLARVESLAGDA